MNKRVEYWRTHSKSENTRRAYRIRWALFCEWCKAKNLNPLPADPETIALYLDHLVHEGKKASTIGLTLSTISQTHKASDYESPTLKSIVKETWAGIQRDIGIRQKGKDPITKVELYSLIRILDNHRIIDIRDKAILLMGFASSLRRSELVSLNVEDIEFVSDGLVIDLKKSKTDVLREGRQIGIVFGSNADCCPVLSLRKWIMMSGIKKGPLFRPINRHEQISSKRLCDRAVSKVVKKAAEAAGLDPEKYSSLSLRSGFVTSAILAGVNERVIMKQTGHTSIAMVHRYFRDVSLFRENATAAIGL